MLLPKVAVVEAAGLCAALVTLPADSINANAAWPSGLLSFLSKGRAINLGALIGSTHGGK